jgi:hypothetical protein
MITLAEESLDLLNEGHFQVTDPGPFPTLRRPWEGPVDGTGGISC